MAPGTLWKSWEEKLPRGHGRSEDWKVMIDLVHQEQPLDSSNHQAAVGDTSQHTVEEVSGACDTLVTMGMQ